MVKLTGGNLPVEATLNDDGYVTLSTTQDNGTVLNVTLTPVTPAPTPTPKGTASTFPTP